MANICEQYAGSDTIAAISTPLGTGGIGVIRISGPDAFTIGGRVFKGRMAFKDMKSHTVAHGKIIDPLNGHFLDDVLLVKMKGPNTFTGEDTVEISCHGGIVVLRNVLSLVLREGARAAGPGEFTKRAFINGKIDLTQAEAVIDLINSKTDEGSRAAAAQMEGRLSQRIRAVRKELVGLIAHIEAVLDYPEYDIEELTGEKVVNGIRSAKDEILKIAKSYDKGKLLKEGISAAIIGKPNAGKSSLLNALAGVNRAIVTDIPGTTRDIIEEYINVNGIPVRFLDTAGIRKTQDPVESIGVERARKAASEADLAIIVLDASTGILPEDSEILAFLKERKKVIIINKTDIADEYKIGAMKQQLEEAGNSSPVIVASMLDGTGMDELLDAISGLFMEGAVDVNNEILITNIRHKTLLEKAAESLASAKQAYEKGLPLDLVAIDIREGAENLGRITGESVAEDIINEIFSRFCIGK
ncbi:MAG: tRNA uridine-5-carboxymethylaminomethyl(34) synthesis GTPase MnmE [Acetivibrionales bacterium]|jgi:tRNA modification GTPase